MALVPSNRERAVNERLEGVRQGPVSRARAPLPAWP